MITGVSLVGCSPSVPVEDTGSSAARPSGSESELQRRPSESDTGEAATNSAAQTSAEDNASLYSPEAFREAALNGKRRIVEVCLESGMKADQADAKGFTPLAMAAYNGHTDVVQLLVDRGATVDARDFQGNTPLIHAASGPAPETVTTLLDAGADINAVDSGEHFTPLMMAAALGNTRVVKVLLQRGARTDMVDVDGDAAIDFARENGHMEIVKLLSDS